MLVDTSTMNSSIQYCVLNLTWASYMVVWCAKFWLQHMPLRVDDKHVTSPQSGEKCRIVWSMGIYMVNKLMLACPIVEGESLEWLWWTWNNQFTIVLYEKSKPLTKHL